MSEETSSYRMKPFSGKEEDWVYWETLFLARAEYKGYRTVADGTEAAPSDASVLVVGTNDAEIKLRNANRAGFSELMSFCTGAKVAFSIVRQSKTNDLPKGCLKTAWAALCERYEPTGAEDAEEIVEEYRECKLKKNEDPEEWLAKKNEIRLRLKIDFQKKDYEDPDFMRTVLFELPEEYTAIATTLKPLIGATTNPLTIKQMTRDLRERYKKMNPTSKDDEKALLSSDEKKKKFGGQCFTCGKWGHKSFECRSGVLTTNTNNTNSQG